MRFKPVIISHHMLMGLKEGQEKMSKSDPDSAIFMEDAAEDVKRKVRSVRSSQSCMTRALPRQPRVIIIVIVLEVTEL
jgi:tryptophanyl-tRNA synthetase